MANRIPPASTIGIIGGGQLGRMLSLAASKMGYKTHIYSPDIDAPAKQVTALATTADYNDLESLKRFASQVDVITFEFENIPSESIRVLSAEKPTYPDYKILRTCQHRVLEKQFVNDCGIETAPFAQVRSLDELNNAVKVTGLPAILKTCEFGYDGKGQAKIITDSDIQAAWNLLSTNDAILEGMINFEREVSVIVARNIGGEIAVYPVVENIHVNHILDTTIAPAKVKPEVERVAREIALKIAEKFNLVGLLAIEMFVCSDGRVLVNEMAPRPHNSGHWSIEGCITSQFEQHIRAVCNLPLGSTDVLRSCTMKNLLGEDIEQWAAHLSNPNAKLHLYGKSEAKSGRKMGHVTFLG